MRKAPSTLFFCALLTLALARAHGQGGPPMITDDPGTPGNGRWEINTAWTEQRGDGSTLIGLPLLDANYGVGDRIELNYQASWNLLRSSGASTRSGLSDSELSVKWRFHDEGEAGLQVAMAPRLSFLDPRSDSDRRGTAERGTAFLLPFEARQDFGEISVDVDLGYTFSSNQELRGWMGGLCLGHDVTKAWEVDVEVHGSGADRLQRSESVLNLGTRVDLSRNATLLLAIGRDFHDSLGRATSLLSYVGLQVRF